MRETDHKNARADDKRCLITQAILTGAVPSPQRKTKSDLSDRKLLEHLGVPEGSHHTITEARKKRKASVLGNEDAYDLLGKRKCGPHRGKLYWHDVRKWIEGCSLSQSNPCMDDTVNERDLYGASLFCFGLSLQVSHSILFHYCFPLLASSIMDHENLYEILIGNQ